MKHLLAAIAALIITSTTPAFAGSPETVVLDVQNMTCPLCPITVRKSLQRVGGVVGAEVDLYQRTATVKFDPDKANIATLVKATTNAGYPATVRK
ncbi:MAG: mercury resistance system periplasmic binding protein MerP [Betaproteobacteria bacterium]|nr:mercury resistance system periplasmic binding protein MerP [Betaproteobacteria bacterium]